jgi:hypothetical protein
MLRMLAASSLLLATPGPAAAGEREPGTYWEHTVEMSMPGMPFAMPPQTNKICLPTRQWTEPPGSAQDKSCKTSDVTRSGDTLSWKVTCTGKDAMKGKGELTTTSDGYHGTMQMKGAQGEMSMKTRGRKLGGDCDAAEQRRQAEALGAEARASVKEAQAGRSDFDKKTCDSAVEGVVVSMMTGTNSMGIKCKDPAMKGPFCKRFESYTGWVRAGENNQGPDRASLEKYCGKTFEQVRGSVCRQAAQEKELLFLDYNCPVEAKAFGKKECAARGRAADLPGLTNFCDRYAAGVVGTASGSAKAATRPAPEAEAGEGAKATTAEDAEQKAKEKAMEEAKKKALRSLLPF